MEIIANEGEWTHTDELALAAFLDSPAGRRFIPALVANSPGLLPGGEINAVLIRSGEVRAFQEVVKGIFLLAHPPAPMQAPTSAYPDLENDRAWNDGQNLDVPKPETPQTPQ